MKNLSAGFCPVVFLVGLHRAARRCGLSFFLTLAALPLSAASPLAMRVDVKTTAITTDGTVMTIEVQLAPQDRGRIGHQARMRVKLNRGSKTLAHILQDVDFDDQGMTRMEHTWPPGSYELVLTIEGLRGATHGLWVGDIDIPKSLDQVPTSELPESKVETPRTEAPAPPLTSQPEAVAVAAAPIAASAPSPPKIPVTANETAAETAPPTPAPKQAPESTPQPPDPVAPTQAAEPSPSEMASAVPAPVPEIQDQVPPPQPVAAPSPRTSGPVYALVLDIERSDIEIADRTADLKASIDRRIEDVAPIILQGGDSNPTLAITRALDTLQPYPEARAIIVITDVRRKASRSQWKTISAAVQGAKIPIFVIGLWNDAFDPGTRKQFKGLATDSGGRSYVLQPAESPSRALEMLDSALKGGPAPTSTELN